MLAAARASAAISGTAEIAAGVGHDTNMFLQVAPDAAGGGVVGGYFGRAAPALTGALTKGGLRLEVSYAADYRYSAGARHLLWQEMDLSLALPPLGPLRWRVAVEGGRFDASSFPDDGFLIGGGAVDARVALSDSLRVLAAYHFQVRGFTFRPVASQQTDLIHLVDLRVPYRPQSQVEIALDGSYVTVATPATTDGAPFRRARGGLDGVVIWQRLTMLAAAFAGALDVGAGGSTWQMGGVVGARVRLTDHLDVAASFDVTGTIAGPPDGGFSRRVGLLTFIGHATTRTALPTALPTTPPTAPAAAKLRPVIQNGRARLRVHATNASEVRVIGSWNDWAEPGTALALAGAAGVWEVWLPLPVGTHRYHFLVGGRPVRPPEAARYLADGFGGEDGVLEVP